jgi:para-nitrobenzyl esterase
MSAARSFFRSALTIIPRLSVKRIVTTTTNAMIAEGRLVKAKTAGGRTTAKNVVTGRFVAVAAFVIKAQTKNKIIIGIVFATTVASNIPVIIGSNTDEGSFFTASKKLDTVEQYNETVVSDSKALADIFDIKVDFDGILTIFPASEYPTPKLAYSGMLRDVAFTCPARALSKQVIKKQPKVYLYLFGKAPDEVGPLKDWGAFHGSELAFVFHNFEFMGIKFKSKDNTATSKRILAYWSRFAHTGDPNVQGLTQWELFDPAKLNYMYLDVETEMRSGYRKSVCDYLDQVLFEK